MRQSPVNLRTESLAFKGEAFDEPGLGFRD